MQAYVRFQYSGETGTLCVPAGCGLCGLGTRAPGERLLVGRVSLAGRICGGCSVFLGACMNEPVSAPL